MYFYIDKDRLNETDIDEWMDKQDAIAVLTNEEWGEDPNIKTGLSLSLRQDKIHFCKLESYVQFLYGTIRTPIKREHEKRVEFAMYILPEKIIFIDDSEGVKRIIEKIKDKKAKKSYSLERFLFDFLTTLIEDDLIYLSSIENDITKMEENIFLKKTDDFNYKMLKLKKEISRLYRYYVQLIDVGEVLMQDEADFFEKDDKLNYHVFTDRVERLQGETQILREYAMQVQDVYQSEIGIRQNDVMKVLTIVTTIFLPLTLIAGWYGMNFVNMPELSFQYGYPIVAGVSVMVIVLSLWLFKKKKYL